MPSTDGGELVLLIVTPTLDLVEKFDLLLPVSGLPDRAQSCRVGLLFETLDAIELPPLLLPLVMPLGQSVTDIITIELLHFCHFCDVSHPQILRSKLDR